MLLRYSASPRVLDSVMYGVCFKNISLVSYDLRRQHAWGLGTASTSSLASVRYADAGWHKFHVRSTDEMNELIFQH